MTNRPDTPKVFVSYSWTSPSHERFVLELAERLTADGVHVVIDKWDLREGHDKYAFMEQMVNDESVQKVLIVSDQRYAEKADAREGGVGTESQIISDEIYSSVAQEKFIPVVAERTKDGEALLPTYLRNRIYVDLSSEEGFQDEYEKLLRNIVGKPITARPPIGVPPRFLTEDEQPLLNKSGQQFKALAVAASTDKSSVHAAGVDYLEALLSALDDHHIQPTESEPFDDAVVESIRRLKPYRDEFADFIDLVAKQPNMASLSEDIFNFFERCARLMYAPENIGAYNDAWFDNYRFLIRELFLYLAAILIKRRCYSDLVPFLSEKYFYSTNTGRMSGDYGDFDKYMPALEEFRKKRLQLNRISITADLSRERADHRVVGFEDLMQVDFVLSMRAAIGRKQVSSLWFPRLLVFADRQEHGGFELFYRAEAHRHFEVVKTLLDVESKDDLVGRFKQAYEDHGMSGWNSGGFPFNFPGLLNLDKLDTA